MRHPSISCSVPRSSHAFPPLVLRCSSGRPRARTFLRYGLGGSDEMAAFLQDEERPLLCIATDQVEDHIDLLSQNLLELRLSIVDNPAGSDGLEVRLIVTACRGNDGGTSMRCQLHRIGAYSAGTTMDQDRLSLFQVTVGEDSVPRGLGGHRHG